MMSEKIIIEDFNKIYEEYKKYSEALEMYRRYKELKRILGKPTVKKFLDKKEIEDNLIGKGILDLVENLGGQNYGRRGDRTRERNTV